ncbi:MAG TPA: alpha/beta fold hydrolase [Pseudonocardiaceae bacterium]|nr:alpha/beta fold hydrolase [Pseudonocardiaceae bacterium]
MTQQVSSTGVACRTAELGHGRTRFFEAGTGDPVILLHGAGFNSGGHSWLPNMPALAQRFHLYAPDALGWGPGDQLDSPYSFAYLVDFVREFQDHLGLARTHVVGHSMGGWLASLLAYESPQRVDRLVLVAAGGLATRQLTSMAAFAAPSADEIRAAIGRLGLPAADEQWLVDERIELAADPVRVDRFRGIMHHMSEPQVRQRYHTARRLPHVRSATLVAWGSDDQVNPLDMGERAAQLIPDARLRVFDGAGHGLPMERPAEFDAAVLDFLGG